MVCAILACSVALAVARPVLARSSVGTEMSNTPYAMTIDIALNARGEAKSCKVIANSQREMDPCAQFPIGESLNAVPGMPASPVGGTVRITMTATYMPD